MTQKNTHNNNYITLVDSHIHINDCYNLKRFFDSAFRNFALHKNKLSALEKFIGVLFLTEAGDYDFFKKFFDEPELYSSKINYKIERTSEETSLKISDRSNCIILIAGQQIITAENLEVLALGTRKRFKYKKKFSDTINSINDSGAICVIPWAVGKWIGKRGKIIKDILQNNSGIFLGDNSGRPVFWPTPKLFSEGMGKKIYTLRGSDPLPFKSQVNKAGSFGFYFNSSIDLNKPFSDIKKLINNLDNKPANYGSLENPLRFFKNQFMLRRVKQRLMT